MLTKFCRLSKSNGSILILWRTSLIPRFRFKWIDHVLTRHQIYKASTDVISEFNVLMLRIKADDILARFQYVAQNEFQKITLALPGVPQDEDTRIGLIAISLVKIYDDIGSVFVSP